MSKLAKATYRVVRSIIKGGRERQPGYEFHACAKGVHVGRWLQQGRIERCAPAPVESEAAK